MHALTCHPATPCRAAIAIAADARFATGGTLLLHFALTGALDAIRLPPPGDAVRADGLWRHSCCEAFLRPAGGESYLELNFAPSTQWAAYRFARYRQGMTPAADLVPRIEVIHAPRRWELRVSLSGLQRADWRLGLSAVIEERDGTLSCWALAHPAGKPDFHAEEGFVVGLGDN